MRHPLRLATLAAGAIMLVSMAPMVRAQDSSNAPQQNDGQQGGGGRMRGGMRRGGGPEEMLMHGINLTDAQRDSLHKLQQANAAQMDSLRKAYVANVRNVLTPDQQAQFDQNMAEMQKRMEEMRARFGQGGPGGPPPGGNPPPPPQ